MEEEAKRLYGRILEIANYFLHNCRNWEVSILAEEDPSYESIARTADKISKVLNVYADDFDPMMCQQALEYCSIMTRMSHAIRDQRQDYLDELTTLLDKKPFIL